MHLIGNELSFFPLADNSHIAEQRFTTLFRTFREAKDRYEFSHVRLPEKYVQLQITQTQTFFEWIETISNPTLKNLVLDLFKAPFTDDLEHQELERFVQSTFEVAHDSVPTHNSPFGLQIAFIKSVPAISFNSHSFWQNRKIRIRKIDPDQIENNEFISYNVCMAGDIGSAELEEWAHKYLSIEIQSETELGIYLGYTKYSVDFGAGFMEQLWEWKEISIERYKYILLLMKDVEIHPFTSGMGQTENLKKRGKEASKRITQSDRLSYSIENDEVTFIACKGHYQFH